MLIKVIIIKTALIIFSKNRNFDIEYSFYLGLAPEKL